jgi:hypothetical protein
MNKLIGLTDIKELSKVAGDCWCWCYTKYAESDDPIKMIGSMSDNDCRTKCGNRSLYDGYAECAEAVLASVEFFDTIK